MQGAVDDSIRFELLGPLRACRGLQELDLGPGKQRAVLATLLLAANRPVPPSQIVELVWGEEPPENGTNVVQKYVAGLRRVLEPDRAPRASGRLLSLSAGGYQLLVAPGHLDLEVFAGHVRQAARFRSLGLLAEASGELQAGFSLWRAEPLAGLTGTYFEATRARLAEDRLAAVEEWAEVELEQGHQQPLLPELNRLVAEHPHRERLRSTHMLALYRTGRQAEALASFREARACLTTRYGVEPGPALQALHSQILQNHPSLTSDAQPPPTPVVPVPIPTPTAAPPAYITAALSAAASVPSPTATRKGVRPFGWQWWLLKLLVGAVPIVTVALASAPLMGVLAIVRRSLGLAIAAGVYLAATIAAYLLIDTTTSSSEITSTKDGIGIGLVLTTALVCALHAVVIVPRTTSPTDPAPDLVLRRRQARQIAADHPMVARQLGIGRPDLPSQLDDGGLIDLNDAPESVLRTLPGASPAQAALIVAERTSRGRFHSVEELVSRGVFTKSIPQQVADVLLVITVQDAVDEDRR